uniref:Uncharacterized protein n=1 Tax=Rhizophora mucronata TaxID=61149 RepID=A0A2P2Q5K5_RHIMU
MSCEGIYNKAHTCQDMQKKQISF